MAILTSMISGESLKLVIEREAPVIDATVTEHPIEKGRSISDHMESKSEAMQLSGIIVGPNHEQHLALLRSWIRDRHLVRYSGRNRLDSYVIQSLRTDHDSSIIDGFRVSITLRQVRIIRRVPDVSNDIISQTREVTDMGRISDMMLPEAGWLQEHRMGIIAKRREMQLRALGSTRLRFYKVITSAR